MTALTAAARTVATAARTHPAARGIRAAGAAVPVLGALTASLAGPWWARGGVTLFLVGVAAFAVTRGERGWVSHVAAYWGSLILDAFRMAILAALFIAVLLLSLAGAAWAAWHFGAPWIADHAAEGVRWAWAQVTPGLPTGFLSRLTS